jgi:hypothetical protein
MKKDSKIEILKENLFIVIVATAATAVTEFYYLGLGQQRTSFGVSLSLDCKCLLQTYQE